MSMPGFSLPLLLRFSCLLLLTAPAMADSLRCGSRLISDGDHPGEVLLRCGEPLYQERKTIYRSGIPQRQPNWPGSYRRQGYDDSLTNEDLARHNRSLSEVAVDVWVDNFGPSA